ncbi:MAG: HEAT repeat domain-containing protein [Gaiellaceae bacterium]
MIVAVALILAFLVGAELIALCGRRAWVQWKGTHRAPLVDDAMTQLADAIVTGVDPAPPVGRVRRRAFRLAALRLFTALAGESRARLTRLVEELGLVEDVLRTLNRSRRAYARRTAADELAEIRSRRAIPLLTRALADRDPMVRVVAVRGLASLADLAQLERMLEVLEQDARGAPAVAASAMLALTQAAPEALVELERGGHAPYARRHAALALATAGDRRAVPSLLAELASENALLASVAVRAIERVGGEDAVSALQEVARDGMRDPALRDQAERALAHVEAKGPA